LKKRKYLFFLIFLFSDIIVSGLSFIRIYDIKTMDIRDGKNFQICNINNYGKSIMSIIFLEKILIIFLVSLMIFLEWNVVKYSKDIKTITSSIYSYGLIAIILIVIKNIEINNYKIYFMVHSAIILLLVFSCYFFIFGIRIIHTMIRKDNDEFELTKSGKLTSSSHIGEKSYETKINKSGYIVGNILRHHYYTGEEYTRSIEKGKNGTSVPSLSGPSSVISLSGPSISTPSINTNTKLFDNDNHIY